MKIIESVEEMREYSQQCKRDGKTIASIETTGYLHEGHMSLVKIAKENADVVVFSLEHNQQYDTWSPELYEKYVKEYRQNPDGLPRDIELCKSHGVDVLVHIPDSSWNFETSVDIPSPYLKLLRKHRDPPALWHNLSGLKTWAQQFEVIRPDVSILGQKDAYQNFVAKSIADKLKIKVIMAPIIRDSDGLAYSSRNILLTPSERQRALSMYQVLQEIASWKEIEPISYIKSYVTYHVKTDICNVDTVCAETLKELIVFDRKMLIVINAFFKDIYLTDNIIMEMK